MNVRAADSSLCTPNCSNSFSAKSSLAISSSAAKRGAQRIGLFVAPVGEFEQTVAALRDERGKFFVRRARFGDERIDFAIGFLAALRVFDGEFQQARAESLVQLAAVGGTGTERIESIAIPLHQHVLRGAGEGGGPDGDVVLLADAIETADALFEQIRIERQIPQDHVVRELEIAAFRADFRAQQQARAVAFGEEGGVAVALHERHRFVEARDLHAAARAQRFFEREHFFLGAAGQEELVVRMRFEQVDQPRQARIFAVVELQRRAGRLHVG